MRLSICFLLLLLPIVSFSEAVKLADRFTIESKAFDDRREVLVSLPESYVNSPDSLYPVIYVVRGQLDLLSVIAAIDMLDTESPEFIVVGVSGMGEEFIPSNQQEQTQFSKLLHDEVVPFIKEKYRTAPYSILVGHSAAAKFVSNDWLSRGDDFSNYYAISPDLNDGAINERFKVINKKELSNKSPLLISVGNESNRMQSMFDELKGFELLQGKVEFIQFEDQTHMSGRVHTVMAGLRSSFKNWMPSKKVESGQFKELKAHYENLSKQYGYEVEIPLDTMKRESAFHAASDIEGRWQVASDIIKYALAKKPSNIEAFFDISDEMIGYGMLDGNKRLLAFICEQAPEHSRCSK